MADEDYDKKVKDMQKYIPFLENLIHKLKNNKDEKREAQLTKMELLYGLLTNKEKKLKLDTLQKCEAVLIKLHSKVEKTPGSIIDDDIAAPASPSNSDFTIEFKRPIVIPTERRRSPAPRSSSHHHRHHSNKSHSATKDSANGRDRPRSHSSSSSTSSNIPKTPELFKRRSPNRDRSSRYDEELRKKYENPKAQKPSQHSQDNSWNRPHVNIKRTGPLPSEVLKSPPLTLDDINNLMNESEETWDDMSNANQNQDSQYDRNRLVGSLGGPKFDTANRPEIKPVEEPVRLAYKYNPHPRRSTEIGQSRTSDLDFNGINSLPSVNPSDPRLRNRPIPVYISDNACPPTPLPNMQSMHSPIANMQSPMHPMQSPMHPMQSPMHPSQSPMHPSQSPMHPSQSPMHPSQSPMHPSQSPMHPMQSPMHPMQSPMHPSQSPMHPSQSPMHPMQSPMHPMQSPMHPSQSPMHPSQSPMHPSQSPMHPSQSPMHPSQSPMHPMQSPMHSMQNSMGPMPDRSQNYGNQPYYGNYQQHQQMHNMMHPSMFMNHPGNRYMQHQAQPRTYGEYRKAKLSETKPDHIRAPPKADSTSIEEPIMSPDSTADLQSPSHLDNMYRSGQYQAESKSNAFGFKIPKIKKDPPFGNSKGKKDTWGADNTGNTGGDNWDDNWDTVDNSANKKAKEQSEDNQEENWDDPDENGCDSINPATKEKEKEEDRNDMDENWDTEEKSWDTIDKSGNNAPKKSNREQDDWDTGEKDWDTIDKSANNAPKKPNRAQDDWDTEKDWDTIDKSANNAPKKSNRAQDDWDATDNWDSIDYGAKTNKKETNKNWDTEENWDCTDPCEKKKEIENKNKDTREKSWDTNEDNWDAIEPSTKNAGHNKNWSSAEPFTKKADYSRNWDYVEPSPGKTFYNKSSDYFEPFAKKASNNMNWDQRKDNLNTTEENWDDIDTSTTNNEWSSPSTTNEFHQKLVDYDDSEDERNGKTKSFVKKSEEVTRESNKNKISRKVPDTAYSNEKFIDHKKGSSKTQLDEQPAEKLKGSPSKTTENNSADDAPKKRRGRPPGKLNNSTKKKKTEETSITDATDIDMVEENLPIAIGKEINKAAKRKTETEQEKVPEKVVKIETNTTQPEPIEIESKELTEVERKEKISIDGNEVEETASAESAEDETLPTTIINSSISAENIIEGRRRTRGSYSRFLTTATSPKQRKSAVASPSPKKSPKNAKKASDESAGTSSATTADTKEVAVKKQPQQENIEKETSPEDEKNKSEQDEASNSKKEEITKEWLESFLLKLFNPAMMSATAVLGMLEKVLDENKFQQVKKIMNPETPSPPAESIAEPATADDIEDLPAEDIEEAPKPKTRQYRGRGKKTELDRLNEDIRDMFISKGVLTATGRRMCTVINEKQVDQIDSDTEITPNKTKSEAITSKLGIKGRRGRKRRKGLGRMWNPGSKARALRQRKEEAEAALLKDGNEDYDEDDIPLSMARKTSIEKNIQDMTDEELLKSIEKKEDNSSSSENVDVLFLGVPKIESTKHANEDLDEKKTIKSDENNTEASKSKANMIRPKRGRRGKGKGKPGRKMISDMNEKDRAFKNVIPEMHAQSEKYTKCALCPFSGRYLSNHYVHVHPLSEVLISRLPPTTQNRMIANEGNTALGAVKKAPNKIVYLYACPFCEIQNTFTRKGWIEHFGTHTGEYTFKCSECSRVLNMKMQILKHIKDHCPKAQAIRLRTLNKGKDRLVLGHICDLCNYIQMNRNNIVNHLINQHNCLEEPITTITLLSCKEIQEIDIKDVIGPIGRRRTDNDQNLEVFMSREQNDLNLDSNFMKFMSDISFSASGSPPQEGTMSVADRINERFKNTNNNPYSIDSLQNIDMMFNPEELHHPLMSMADRLSERFSGVSSLEGTKSPIKNDIAEDNSKNNTTADNVSIASMSDKNNAKLDNTSDELDDDVIVISDGDDDLNLKRPGIVPSKIYVKKEKNLSGDSESEPEANEAANENDDDDDWVDIETPPSPSCLEGETKSPILNETKTKKNKTIYATLSRLYASIVQPKGKKKTEASNTDGPSTSTVVPETTTSEKDKKLESKKPDPAVMHRINKLGYSKKSSDIIKYHCLVDSCSFLYSDIPVGLESHVIYEHPTLLWEGYCHVCRSQVSTEPNMKLAKELQHMQEVHINAKISNEKEPTSNTNGKDPPPALKIRRLSGDMLSSVKDGAQIITKQSSPPPLQISSAVSLNKASAIWQTVGNVMKTPDKQSAPLPIVIKQVFSGGAPSTVTAITPRSNLKITKISSPNGTAMPSQSNVAPQTTLKISKVTSMGETVISPNAIDTSSSTTSIRVISQNSQLKIASISSAGETKSMELGTVEQRPLNMTDLLKLSLPEKQVLKEIKPTTLKPWTLSKSRKSDMLVEGLLSDICLYALFKCMGNECEFTTNDPEKMLKHLNNHSEHQKRVQAETNAFSWLECCYCNIWTGKVSKLISHIIEKHSKDIYQCPYCFYRSCEEYNLIIHLNQHHPNEKILILVCFGEKPLQKTELNVAKDGMNRNVKEIKCSDCPATFMNPVEFSKHIEGHQSTPAGSDTYKCYHCLPNCNITAKQLAVNHLMWKHNISCYECVHCSFASEEKSRMILHMANCHASNLLFCCIRIAMLDTASNDEIHTKFNNETALTLLNQKVDSKYFQMCPYTADQLSFKSAVLNDYEKRSSDNPIVYSNAVKRDNPVITQNPGGLEISQVQTISNKAFSMIDNNQIDDTTPKTDIIAKEIELPHTKIINAAKDIVRNTGVSHDELCRCGFPNCNDTSPTFKEFRIHLIKEHTRSGIPTEMYYPCHYCEKKFNTIVECMAHYKEHQQHRYFCFLCFHTAPSVPIMIKHVSTTHAIRTKANIVTYALIKGMFDSHKDFFFVCSTANKAPEICRFGDRLLKMWERKKWSQMQKSFTPDDVEQLPRQAIFFDELFCAICQYRTKVRTNLYRHLQFHKKEVDVANIDPVNPVPCLNTPEKHFDKMTNLACSSNEGKPLGGSSTSTIGSGSIAALGTNSGILRRIEHVLPDFIPPKNRYMCGIPICLYLTVSEVLLKQHLTTLHPSEKNYTCPHCEVVICANKVCADKIIHHLKFHDTNLYQCRRCGYLHFHKPVMERHLSEKHSNDNATYIIYNRNETVVKKSFSESRYPGEKTMNDDAAIQTTETAKSIISNQKWQCALCKTQTVTQNQMITHLNIAHNIKYRYQCSKCNFGGVLISAITDHAIKKHPNKVSEVLCFYTTLDSTSMDKSNDTTPLWRRDPNKIKNIRGILMEEETIPPIMQPPIAESELLVAVANNSNQSVICNKEQDEIEIKPKEEIVIKEDIEKSEGSNDADEVENPFGNLTAESRMCHICSHIAPSNDDLHSHIFESHSTDSIEENKLLNKAFKYVCYYCKMSCNTFVALTKHWRNVHKSLPNTTITKDDSQLQGRPLWFKVTKRYQCSLCAKSDDYREIAIHHYLEHSGNQFATRDATLNSQCGHCPFTYGSNVNELCDHYKAQHPPDSSGSSTTEPLIPKEPPCLLSNQALGNLQKTGWSGKWLKCKICSLILYDKTTYEMHYEANHAIEKKSFEILSKGKYFKCPTCNYTSSSEEQTIRHINRKEKKSFEILSKEIYFKCPTCNYISSSEEQTIRHINRKVNAKNMEFENKTELNGVDENLQPYVIMEIIFPNGFVIEKYKLPTASLGSLVKIATILKQLEKSEQNRASSTATLSEIDPLKCESDDAADPLAETTSPITRSKRNNSSKLDSIQENDFLSNLFKFNCYHCKTSCETFAALAKHWQQEHKILRKAVSREKNKQHGRPLWFKLEKRYQCSQCSKSDDYRQIAIHHYLEHSSNLFATRDVTNKLKCGHCTYTFESDVSDLCDHYKAEHPPENNDSSIEEPPIPKQPQGLISTEVLEHLQKFGQPGKFFKCKICSLILCDKKAHEMHYVANHNAAGKSFEVLADQVHYKCPTCNFISLNEEHIVKHINQKVKEKNMKLESKTDLIDMDENLRPYAMMELLFSNGFIVEKYKLPRSSLGNIENIERILKQSDESEQRETASESSSISSKIDNTPPKSCDTDDTANSIALTRPKRRITRRSASKMANVDQLQSEDEYKPRKRRKFKSAASLEQEKILNPKQEPYSFYGTTPIQTDLSKINANISIDGVDKIEVDDKILTAATEANVEAMDTTEAVDANVEAMEKMEPVDVSIEEPDASNK